MEEYITIGSTPSGEDCAQVGSDSYAHKSRAECLAFMHQLNRVFGTVPNGRLAIKSFPHDFGSYREVCACYKLDDEKAAAWAFNIEANTPELWDDEAKRELGL